MGLLIRNARILRVSPGPALRRAGEMNDPLPLDRADVRIDGASISQVGHGLPEHPGDRAIDAAGRVLMPAFVDCHTHACFAGSRLDEWELRRRGVPYLDILHAGGGIMATVRAVRAATQHELARSLLARLSRFLVGGTLTVEIKSGYGLSTRDELKMLRAIADAARDFPGTIVPTALLGHAIDTSTPDFARRTVEETLPEVSREFPGIAIDAYCESGAWSFSDCTRLFERAIALGHPCRVHADQFNSLGMTPWACAHAFRSADHLEASNAEDLRTLAASQTVGVGLPICGLHMDNRFAPLRHLLDAGGACAIATNCNPGTAPTTSMPLAIATGVRHCGLSPAEAIAACTINAAQVLGLTDRGFIAPGARADLLLLACTDERSLAYDLGPAPIHAIIQAGSVLTPREPDQPLDW